MEDSSQPSPDSNNKVEKSVGWLVADRNKSTKTLQKILKKDPLPLKGSAALLLLEHAAQILKGAMRNDAEVHQQDTR